MIRKLHSATRRVRAWTIAILLLIMLATALPVAAGIGTSPSTGSADALWQQRAAPVGKATITIGKDSMRVGCLNNDGRFYEDPDGSYGCILPSGADVHCTADSSCTVKTKSVAPPGIGTSPGATRLQTPGVLSRSGAGSEAAGGTSAVYINKHGCPAGFNADAADLNSLAANCQATMNGVTFVVSDGGVHIFTQQTGGSPESAAQFVNLPATLYAILEQVPTGYSEPVVYCDGYGANEPGPSDLARMPVYSGNQINYNLAVDETLYCDWFNVLGGGASPTAPPVAGAVFVNKHRCPAGISATANLATLAQQCQGTMNGVTFSLAETASNGSGTIVSQATGDIQNSAAVFNGLGAGSIIVGEVIPTGFGEPAVFCDGYLSNEPGPSNVQRMNVVSGFRINYQLAAGETLYCDWYNVSPPHALKTPGPIQQPAAATPIASTGRGDE